MTCEKLRKAFVFDKKCSKDLMFLRIPIIDLNQPLLYRNQKRR